MHRDSQTQQSSPIPSHSSLAGPSTPPRPVPQTPAATLASIRETGASTISLINNWRKQTPTTQALTGVLRTSLTKHDALLNTTEELDPETLDRLNDLNTILLDVQRAVNAEVRPRKRHVAKGVMMKLLGTTLPDVFPLCQTRVMHGFQALELTLPVPTSTPPTNTSHQGPSTSAVRVVTPPPSQPVLSDRAKTALDVTDTVLQVTMGIGEVAPLAGPILKAVGSIGLAIIKILNGVVNNKEEARSLAKYVQDLVATANRFTETGTQIEGETMVKLRAFEATLNAVQGDLEKFMAQGGFRQGVSHIRNKEVLAGCDTQIRRSFTQLQVHLSLDAVQILASLGDTDARRERDRLLDRLGNAETGATDKASDPADLMCLDGTRVELLAEVDRWALSPSSKRVLWINGVAGCGKSAIAATIASRREKQSATAIFHFSRSNQPRNKRVVCSIARQLAQKVVRGSGESPVDLVMDSVKRNPDIADMHLSTQFKHLLVDPLSKLMPDSPPVLIIIDALDEWDNEDAASKLVHMIHDHSSKLPASVKFILTSRKESHLTRAFGGPRITSLVKLLALDIDAQATVDQDIRTYLQKRFDRICSDSTEISASTWPGTEAIEQLVTLSGGLFQWASTVVRFVEKGSHKVRLKEIFARPNQLGDLDALYRLVFTTFLQNNDRDSLPPLLHHILGSIVVAPTPISLDMLVYLHSSDHDALEDTTADIKEILETLGSLLIVPVYSNEPIRVLHPSIIDFLTDRKRCINENLHADRVTQNRRLALLCLDRMQRDLKRDICGVGDARKFNTDTDVQELVSEHIPGPLQYACRYWAEHLLASGVTNSVELDDPLRNFCTIYMLFWFEAMSLTSMFQQAVAAIKTAQQWVTLCPADPTNSTVRSLLHDARRFLLMYSDPIRANAAHIYLSGLSTVPTGTELAKTYQDMKSGGVRTLAGPIAEHWPGSLWVANRHLGAVRCCAFSPDGRILASGSVDNTLRLWDVETGVQMGLSFEGHTKQITCLAFSPDGKTLVSGSWDRTLRLWDVDTGVQRGPALEGHTWDITCLAFSPDGKTLASGSEDTLRLWDVDTGVQRGPALEGHTSQITGLAFSPDGKTLASGSWDSTLRLWDVDTGVQRGPALEGHTWDITCLAFSPDGKTLASGSEDTLRLWDVDTGVQRGRALEGHTREITCLGFSPDGETLASGSWDSTLRLWDVDTGVQRGPALKGHTERITCLAFSPDGKTLASGSIDNTLRLWDVETGVQRGSALEGHTLEIACLAFSPDGKTLVSGSPDRTLRLWDIETGGQREPMLKGYTSPIISLAFSPDGRTLASGSHDGTLRLWDEIGAQKGPALEGHTERITCLAFSPDGKTLASGSYYNTLRLWDVETGVQRGPASEGHTREIGVRRRPAVPVGGRTERITCLAFSPDGKTLASGSHRNSLRLWDVETGVQRGLGWERYIPGITCLAFSPDGKTLALATSVDTLPDSEMLRLWDIETGEWKGRALRLACNPKLLQFSPSGNKILATSYNGSQWGIDMIALVSQKSSHNEWAPETSVIAVKAATRIGPDGWVRDGSVRWFWLSPAFGRDIAGELRENRFVFTHHGYVCVVDVSNILYLIE